MTLQELTEDELDVALPGLCAYDGGETDTGIHDETLRRRCIVRLKSMDADQFRLFMSRHVREQYLVEDALTLGYGIEDAKRFIDWLEDDMGVSI